MRQFQKPVAGRGRRGIHQWTQDGKKVGQTGPKMPQHRGLAGGGGSLPPRLESAVQASLIIVLSKVAKPPFPGSSFFLQETRKNERCKNLHNLNHGLPHFVTQEG